MSFPPPTTAPADERPCIVHIVRAANGIDAFRSFLAAMRRCPPGADHELVLAMKGFSDDASSDAYLELARDLDARALFFADEGFDLGVYFAVAARLRRQRYCFLNSFSEPLVDGWLALLDRALDGHQVGIAGATGSWSSSRSWVLYSLRMPSAYQRVLPPRVSVRAQFRSIDLERSPPEQEDDPPEGRTPHSRLAAAVNLASAARQAISELPGQLRHFDSFPCRHVRTNAFAIAHSTLARLQLHDVRTKFDAYLLESGRHSITRQVEEAGLRAVVVDSAGGTYDPDMWHKSETFWQGGQQKLLVADNQTRLYQNGDVDRRRFLAAMAWGDISA